MDPIILYLIVGGIIIFCLVIKYWHRINKALTEFHSLSFQKENNLPINNLPKKDTPPAISNKSAKGVGLTCFGVLLTIGGTIGLARFINHPFHVFSSHSFQFGGCGRGGGPFPCNHCEELTVILAVSVIALIIGVVAGIRGIVQIKDSKQ